MQVEVPVQVAVDVRPVRSASMSAHAACVVQLSGMICVEWKLSISSPDMSLVRGIDSSPVKQKLVRSIIALCTELGIQLVAEGIETPAERDALIALGGDLCQGYLFAKPGRGFPTPAI